MSEPVADLRVGSTPTAYQMPNEPVFVVADGVQLVIR